MDPRTTSTISGSAAAGSIGDRVGVADQGLRLRKPRLVVHQQGAQRLAAVDGVADLLVQDHPTA